MTAALSSLAAVAVLLIVGLAAFIEASHCARPWRIGPTMLCGASAFWLADRVLYAAGHAVSYAQAPWKSYMPALVVLGAALTIAGLLYRRSRP